MATVLKLKALLKRLGLSQAGFSRALRISTGTMADILNHGYRTADWADLSLRIAEQLRLAGASDKAIASALDHRAAPTKKQNAQGLRANANPGHSTADVGSSPAPASTPDEKEDSMLLQCQTLSAGARKHFGLFRDPFVGDISGHEDVFLSSDIRYVRETLWQHAKHGGLMALVGESGSGKSTLVAEFKDRLIRESREVSVIEPAVLYMEESDKKGKTLKSEHIINAIIYTVAPSTSPKRDPEAKARQVQEMLRAGHRAGQRHVLVIEEAHCLPTPTLKHLKRFAEIKDGLHPLLAIVLVGQPELRKRLAVQNSDVREVAQRCELIELPPLDNNLAEYLRFKFSRVGMALDKVFTPGAVEALRERLTVSRRGTTGSPYQALSITYPLAVANAATAAMNLAFSIGAPLVDEAIVKEV